jgi:hypothetical protein
MGSGARGIAMGNSLSAVRVGDLSSYYNPSLIPFQSAPVVSAAYGLLSMDRRLNFISYTKNLKPDAGLSLSIINTGVGNIQGRDRDAIPTEILSTSENSFALSFGLRPSPRFSLGVSAKILYYSLYKEVRSTSVGLDFGFSYLPSDALTVSVVLQDINLKYKWDTTKIFGKSGNNSTDLFPLRKRLALSYYDAGLRMLVCGEVETIGSNGLARIGVEWTVTENLSLRGGWDQISLTRSVDSKPSAGFSFSQPFAGWRPTFEYAFVLEPYVGSGMHLLGLSVRIE